VVKAAGAVVVPRAPLRSRPVKVAVLLTLALAGVGAYADQYWFEFHFNDPNDLPDAGWNRHYGPAPFGVVQEGVLTYDSNDPQSYDYFEYHRPGEFDPGPGQIFICQWKLWTEWVSYWGDPGIGVMSDDAWALTLVFDVDVIHSSHEYVDIDIPPGSWHVYTLVSESMRTYQLYIDATLAREGSFAHRFLISQFTWGDIVQGAASRHHWDFLRFGVVSVPEMLAGDLDCDGSVGFGDINPFILALTDPSAYEALYPACPVENGDINADGSVNFGDINPFVALLSS
jgi:hypothetical protein